MLELKVSGLDQLINNMGTLERKVQRTAVTRAARAGAWLIARQARENVSKYDDPSTPNNIAKNITVRTNSRLGRKKGGAAMQVGVRGGAKSYVNSSPNRRAGRVGQAYESAGSKLNPGGDTYYWRFLEFGTSKRVARPFLRIASTQKGAEAFEETARVLSAEITKETRGFK